MPRVMKTEMTGLHFITFQFNFKVFKSTADIKGQTETSTKQGALK